MHILQLITTLNPGGAENHLKTLSRGLRGRGHDIEVAYLLQGYGQLTAEFKHSGIPVHSLDMQSRTDWAVARRYSSLLATGQYDLVHTHLIRSDILGALTSMLGRHDCPVVSSKHNDDWFYRRWPVAVLERGLCARSQKVIAISEAVARFYRERRLIRDTSKLQVIHYGLDVEDFDRRAAGASVAAVRESLGMGINQPLILSVGRLTAQKGQRYLIEGFAAVVAQFPDARLVIVGEGELRAQLEAQIDQCGLRRNVLLPGWRADVPQIMRAADLFVLPSLWEGFGLVLLEAMAARLPVIASQVSAIPEIVEAPATGRLVPAAVPAALAEGICTYLTSADLRAEAGQAGRQRVEKFFTAERMVTATLELYEKVRQLTAPCLAKTSGQI